MGELHERPSPAGYNFTKISSLCISALQMVLPLQHAKGSEMPTAAMAKARRPLLGAARGVGLTAARRHLRTSAGGARDGAQAGTQRLTDQSWAWREGDGRDVRNGSMRVRWIFLSWLVPDLQRIFSFWNRSAPYILQPNAR
jgi:hypothetical protein